MGGYRWVALPPVSLTLARPVHRGTPLPRRAVADAHPAGPGLAIRCRYLVVCRRKRVVLRYTGNGTRERHAARGRVPAGQANGAGTACRLRRALAAAPLPVKIAAGRGPGAASAVFAGAVPHPGGAGLRAGRGVRAGTARWSPRCPWPSGAWGWSPAVTHQSGAAAVPARCCCSRSRWWPPRTPRSSPAGSCRAGRWPGRCSGRCRWRCSPGGSGQREPFVSVIARLGARLRRPGLAAGPGPRRNPHRPGSAAGPWRCRGWRAAPGAPARTAPRPGRPTGGTGAPGRGGRPGEVSRVVQTAEGSLRPADAEPARDRGGSDPQLPEITVDAGHGRAGQHDRPGPGQGADPPDHRVGRGRAAAGHGRVRHRQADAALRLPRPAGHRQDLGRPDHRQDLLCVRPAGHPGGGRGAAGRPGRRVPRRHRDQDQRAGRTPRSAGSCSSTRRTAW